jgi:hypothetical protein
MNLEELAPYQGGRRALVLGGIVGAAGLVLTLVGGFFDAKHAILSYLVAFMFWLGVCLGALALNMANYAARARWHVVIRRAIEAVQAPLPIFLVLFVPIVIFARHAFIWISPPAGLSEEVMEAIHHKEGYLNVGFFVVRALVYFGVWILLSELLYRWSIAQDETGEARFTARSRRWGAGGLPFFALALTFAVFDWVMSLDPTFYSTIFGLYVFAGSFDAFLGALIVLLFLSHREPHAFGVLVRVDHFHNIGKLLLAFVAFWAYMAFSQYMLIWVASLPEEIPWVLVRTRGPWKPVFVLLCLGHFVLPFFALLSRDLKRHPAALVVPAIWMMFMHLVDLCWLILPAAEQTDLARNWEVTGLNVHWTLVTAFVGVGGLTLAAGAFRASRPLRRADPRSVPARFAGVRAAMSHEPSHSTEHLPPPPAQAEEAIASGKVLLVGILALLVFGGATFWSTHIWRETRTRLEPTGPIAPGAEIGKPEIGIVDQVPFETVRTAERTRAEQSKQLQSYGWIDRDKGLIHVPIDKAIDQFVAEKGKKQ